MAGKSSKPDISKSRVIQSKINPMPTGKIKINNTTAKHSKQPKTRRKV